MFPDEYSRSHTLAGQEGRLWIPHPHRSPFFKWPDRHECNSRPFHTDWRTLRWICDWVVFNELTPRTFTFKAVLAPYIYSTHSLIVEYSCPLRRSYTSWSQGPDGEQGVTCDKAFPITTSDCRRILDGQDISNTLSLPTGLLIFLAVGKESYSNTMIDAGLEIFRASVSIVLIASKANRL